MWPVFFVRWDAGIGISGQRTAQEGCAMGVWGVIVSVWAAVLAGLRRAEIVHDLPPTARKLPPTATICQFLTRGDCSSTDARRPMCLRKNEARQGPGPISLAGLELGHIAFLRRAEMRSVASHRPPKTVVEGLQSFATDCHTSHEGSGRDVRVIMRNGGEVCDRDGMGGTLGPQLTSGVATVAKNTAAKNAVARKAGCEERWGRILSPRRSDASAGFRRHIVDRSQQQGGIWRQQTTEFGPRMAPGGGGWRDSRSPSLVCGNLEDAFGDGLTEIGLQPNGDCDSCSTTDGIGLGGGKGSETTTNYDTMKNQRVDRSFGRGHPDERANFPTGRGREGASPKCCSAACCMVPNAAWLPGPWIRDCPWCHSRKCLLKSSRSDTFLDALSEAESST